ncbi:hypothetical protein [Klebsiella pneumoniae]
MTYYAENGWAEADNNIAEKCAADGQSGS